MNICLFGASSKTLDDIYYDEAKALGIAIGRAGHTLIYGGSDCGLMKSCADGVLESGGQLIGVAPKFFNDAGILSTSCSSFIYTDTMSERKQKMEDIADAFITVPGGIGTYDEFFETMTLRQLNVHRKPLALLNTNGYFDPLYSLLKFTAEKRFMKESCLELFRLCATPEEAVEYIQSDGAGLVTGGGLTAYA